MYTCTKTKNTPVVPSDKLRHKLKKNNSADIYAHIEGVWQKIGFVNEWPVHIKNPTITFRVPHPYQLRIRIQSRD